jgi:hypothetical protein
VSADLRFLSVWQVVGIDILMGCKGAVRAFYFFYCIRGCAALRALRAALRALLLRAR